MSRRKLVAICVLGVLVAVGIAGPLMVEAAGPAARGAWADRPLAKLIRGQIGRLMVLHSELNLTKDQKTQIGQVLKSHKAEIARVAHGVWEKRVALRAAVLAENAKEEAVRKAASDLGLAIGDAAVLGSKLAGEIRPLLTEEQRKLIRETHEDGEQAVERFFQKALTAE